MQLHLDQKGMQEKWRKDELINAIEAGESSPATDIQSLEDFRRFFSDPQGNG